MLSRRFELMIGLGVMALSALTLWWLIPAYVALPQRPPLRALAPSFWPKIICWIMLLCGAAMTLRAAMTPPPPDVIVDSQTASPPELMRLAGLAAILMGAYFALPVFGMVWVCMVTFILLVLMSNSKHLILGLVVGVVLPLGLYFFFSKVAGVAIPQGQFVRLP
ncbi:tripartite tricarboxylate transporter TctB family protein [Oceaniglobus ichthyenteri]|uniref:tripartite tricarboxylate transporter TctB family protein n=1 Tax=Oceaniglobus ichthyenteri TaxID=2136177 RepID=UPI000D3CE637|nr:tripartite tricarboxylate transporter TctB family protein [Oceaniglobus ichthyenteri]